MQHDIGLIGLAVMGENLVLNMVDNGFSVSVYNRTTRKTDQFIETKAAGKLIFGAQSLQEFFNSLKRPRKVILMVKAGAPVDSFIEQCLPFLKKGDILIDGGNSHFEDTSRREEELHEKGIHFLGTGISGGEEGARFGPSIMPGGSIEGWEQCKEILQSIAAKAPDSNDPCCNYIGKKGAGHFVKMVHNGIEYGDMQLIGEAVELLHTGLQLSFDAIADIFEEWNKGPLNSFLIEITATLLRKKDDDGSPLVTKILDVAEQKGTGKWTSEAALDLGAPLSLITESVFCRMVSTFKNEREEAAKIVERKTKSYTGDPTLFIQALHDALYASKIMSYTQGFMLLRQASKTYDFNLNFPEIALLWRAGCIIRSSFLTDIEKAYKKNPDLFCLFLDPFFKNEVLERENNWKKTLSDAIDMGIPVPCLSSGYNFFLSFTTSRLSAYVIQAQRDFFGAHTYERIDKPRGEYFHSKWM